MTSAAGAMVQRLIVQQTVADSDRPDQTIGMPRGPRVDSIPTRPVLVYDGTCASCCSWAHRWQAADPGIRDLLPAQAASVRERFPEISTQALAKAVHIIETDGCVYSGAEAIVWALAHGKPQCWPWRLYRESPRLARLAEWAYGWVASRRAILSWITARVSRAP